MSLDVNLFTLNFTPDKQNPNITDLVDPSDNPHYRKERIPGSEYRINVYGGRAVYLYPPFTMFSAMERPYIAVVISVRHSSKPYK